MADLNVVREKEDRCGTCLFWMESLQFSKPLGYCRRHAPKGKSFPETQEGWWCGDYQTQDGEREQEKDELKVW